MADLKLVSRKKRSECPLVTLDPTTDRILQSHEPVGDIVEWTVVHQFHPRFDSLVKATGGPRSFCGVAAPVVAVQASEVVRSALHSGQHFSDAMVRELLAAVSDIGPFTDSCRRGLQALQASRERYCSGNDILRQHGKARNSYLRNWVANYEVSALAVPLLNVEAQCVDGFGGVGFVRANQYPMLAEATFEEKHWIQVEEMPFGGRVVGNAPVYDAPTDRAVTVDLLTTFAPASLMPFDDFMRTSVLATVPPVDAPRVFIVDQQGHYAAQLFYVSDAGVPTTVILNTLADRRASDSVPALSLITHDLCCALLHRPDSAATTTRCADGASADDAIEIE